MKKSNIKETQKKKQTNKQTRLKKKKHSINSERHRYSDISKV